MATFLSTRGHRSFSAFRTSIPEITHNLYHAGSNPSGVISLALSENHLVHGPVTEFMNKSFIIDEATASTYAGTTIGGTRLRKAMTGHINKYFQPHVPVEISNVCVANGVTAILSMLAFMLGDVGDGIILMRPIYGKFENDLTIITQCKTLYTSMEIVDPFSPEVVQCYEARLQQAKTEGTKPRALLICNPHNPSGRCYPRSTLTALLAFCAKHSLHLIADELYALSVFETSDPTAVPFTSVLSIDTEGLIDPRLIHVEYGLSKDFGAPGLHVAALVSRNTEVLKSFQAIGLLHAPGGPSCTIAATMLEDEVFVENIRKLSCKQLAENYAMVTGMLEEAGIPYWKAGRAGFFIWMDLQEFLPPASGGESDEMRDKILSERLLEGGIWLNPGAEWADCAGGFRLIFSHKKEIVEEGVKRIIWTLRGNPKSLETS